MELLDYETTWNMSTIQVRDMAQNGTGQEYEDPTINLVYTMLNSTNSTGNVTLGEENKYQLPWWHQLIWSVFFGGMVVVATGGNLIVIWIVLADRRMRTVTNIFLVNLSVADAMVSTLNVVFNFTYMLNLHWRFGRIYCKISQFVSILSICASVFTLMAISFDR
ncbi:tachykinin-like peptides receptor 99D [Homarus americanus]|uniref:tachykinin-like peptides receptor 99D n=1 Tax=Homarus americanus TaxID=6706 RepID=UPI001C457BA7|nr:tachykinin-like peptides receptor 99D [Homarus americanus]